MPQKKNAEPGCFSKLFAILLLLCIFALIVDYLKAHVPTWIINVVLSTCAVLIILILVLKFWNQLSLLLGKIKKKGEKQKIQPKPHLIENTAAELTTPPTIPTTHQTLQYSIENTTTHPETDSSDSNPYDWRKIVVCIAKYSTISSAVLQRCLHCSFNQAHEILEKLQEFGLVEHQDEIMPYRVLIKVSDLDKMKFYSNHVEFDPTTPSKPHDNGAQEETLDDFDLPAILESEEYQTIKEFLKKEQQIDIKTFFGMYQIQDTVQDKQKYRRILKILAVLKAYDFIQVTPESIIYIEQDSLQLELNKIDAMVADGWKFEKYIADLLLKVGFASAYTTSGSNDYGVDVVAKKDGITYALQCKCYSNKLNNKPVQEVLAGMAYYKAHVGIVVTNNYFTENAVQLAIANNILLWDRDKIIEMLRNIGKK